MNLVEQIRQWAEVVNVREASGELIVRFRGDRGEGFRVFGLAMQHGMAAHALRRTWGIVDGEPTGPLWELVFSAPVSGSATGTVAGVTAATGDRP